jgi:hypothetical protein
VFEQLPEPVQIRLLRDFIHRSFLEKFSKVFVFPNNDIKVEHAYYGWEDDAYKEFMLEMLMNLEPRRENSMTVILEHLEEASEVLFFDHGCYAVGLEINRQQFFAMKFKNSNVISAYECTYNLRSEWIYKTITECTGFSIRKKNWLNLLMCHHDIVDELRS